MKRIYGTALGLLGLAVTAGAASAAPAYTEAALNLRSGPGTGYGVIVAMPAGAPVEIIECHGNGWCEVAWNGYRGFASEAYLTSSGYAAPAPYSPPAYYTRPYYGYSRPYYSYGPSIGFYFRDDDRDHRRRYYRRDRDWDRDRDSRRHSRRDRDDRDRYSGRNRARGNDRPIQGRERNDREGWGYKGGDNRGG